MAGRPLKWKSVEEIKPLIDKYFEETPKDEWTITGLALALDTSRSTIIDYCNRAEDEDNEKVSLEFSNTIKKAKEMVEHSYEVDLKKAGRTGTIFALKNFDWKDQTEVNQKTEIKGKIANINVKDATEEEIDSFLLGELS